MIRVLIVDDEALVRERIRTLLGRHDSITIVGECADGMEAVRRIRSEKPDLVFLDVHMPGVDGFGVLAHLPAAIRPCVVFVTAYDEYAIRAFDVGAADYVLKPIQPERFAKAVRRAIDRLAASPSVRAAQLSGVLRDVSDHGHGLERFIVERRGKMEILPASDVRWLESVGNYVRVYAVGGERHLIRTTLRALAEQLDQRRFVRIHRGTIVQGSFISRIAPHGHGTAIVTLDDGTQLMASRRRAAALRALLRPPVSHD
jgi:two-component system LytT family response regulator